MWEYKILIHTDTDDPKELNKLGAEGWELVAATTEPTLGDSSIEKLYFKRLPKGY